MQREISDLILDILPAICATSLISTFLKGTKGFLQYIKALCASLILGVPAALLVEYLCHDPMIKYAIVLAVSSFGICLFNGLFKIFKGFEEDPAGTVQKIKESIRKE